MGAGHLRDPSPTIIGSGNTDKIKSQATTTSICPIGQDIVFALRLTAKA